MIRKSPTTTFHPFIPLQDSGANGEHNKEKEEPGSLFRERVAEETDGIEEENNPMKTTLGFLRLPPPCRSCPCSSWKVMAKSKKPDSSSSSSSSNEGSAPTPPRITSNVKQNLQFIKLWKEYQTNKSMTSRPSPSYRKKKLEKEELPKDIELYKEPTMNLTNQGLDTGVPVLLVDGYNVCGYWSKLKKHFMKGRLDIARQLLIDELRTFSGIRVVVVFDAMMSGLPSHKENFAGIDLIFSSDMDADSWIEKEVVALKEDGCAEVWVATDDHWEQQAAFGSGAFVWSCSTLISEIKASRKEADDALHELRSTSVQGKLLKHNLAPDVVDALRDLRAKLSKNGMPYP